MSTPDCNPPGGWTQSRGRHSWLPTLSKKTGVFPPPGGPFLCKQHPEVRLSCKQHPGSGWDPLSEWERPDGCPPHDEQVLPQAHTWRGPGRTWQTIDFCFCFLFFVFCFLFLTEQNLTKHNLLFLLGEYSCHF